MTSFAQTTHANTLAGVDRASEVIEHIAAFFRGALRGGIATLLLSMLAAVAMVVGRIDTMSHGSHLIDLAAICAFATVAVTLLSGRAPR